jgi:hypothetical protein
MTVRTACSPFGPLPDGGDRSIRGSLVWCHDESPHPHPSRRLRPCPDSRGLRGKPLDWFHRQLAAAHRAKISHLPRGDSAGAQRAYYAVMLPVCGQVAKSGPAQYRARCQALVLRASNAAAAAAYNPPCDDDHDDTGDTPAEITACSD